nr:MAG TPA: hypothetical protein [Caudoviricetes sp.]
MDSANLFNLLLSPKLVTDHIYMATRHFWRILTFC